MTKRTEMWIAGRIMLPVSITPVGDRLELEYPFNKSLIAEVKNMSGARWHGYETPSRKLWSVADDEHNQYTMAYLRGEKPFLRFVVPDDYKVTPSRPALMSHQLDMIRCAMYTFTVGPGAILIGGEPGTGKTLASIEIMELSGITDWIFVAPRTALIAVARELRIWKSKVMPRLMSPEQLVAAVEENDKYFRVPQGFIYDESQIFMHAGSKRSKAAKEMARTVRRVHGKKSFCIEMTGTPSPLDPCGWWHQCEIVCPGYLVEGDEYKLRKRLALQEKKDSPSGGSFYKHITWLDNSDKCATCGVTKDKHVSGYGHDWKTSVNEVEKLGRRIKGLVRIYLKKDCLDLPPLNYKRIYCQPTKDVLNAARIIAKTAPTTIQKLTRLRELSDGFQYQYVTSDDLTTCPACNGTGKVLALGGGEIGCFNCSGTGQENVVKRETLAVGGPKDDALRDLLDEHEGIGRFIVYGAYQASIDRIVGIAQEKEWLTIRVDGRGWDKSALFSNLDPLDCFQTYRERFPKVCFIGHPASAGVSLTLTASPSILYFSNDFNAVNRMQSQARIHRLSQMHPHLTIFDLIHLPVDELVLDNLTNKETLQAITMGDIDKAVNLGER